MFNNFLFQKIASVFSGVIFFFGSLFSPHVSVQSPQILGATNQIADVVALFTTSLQSSITSSATSFTLNSATYNNGASTLASSTYGFILDEGTAVEEIVLADCTATVCTNATRGLDRQTGTTTVSALQFSHRRGASVKITDAPTLLYAMNVFKGRQNLESVLTYSSQLLLPIASSTSTQLPYVSWIFNNFVNNNGSQSISGVKTFVSAPVSSAVCSAGTEYCNKTYIDAQVVAGGTDATYTVKGISEKATVDEINAGTSLGGTGASLFVNPSDLVFSNYASTTSSILTSTTTTYNIGTTTLTITNAQSLNAPHIKLFLMATSTTAAGGQVCLTFNGESTGTNYSYGAINTESNSTGSAGANGTRQACVMVGTINGVQSISVSVDIVNINGLAKFGQGYFISGNTNLSSITNSYVSHFRWASTTPITSISITSNSAAGIFGTSTYMEVTK